MLKYDLNKYIDDNEKTIKYMINNDGNYFHDLTHELAEMTEEEINIITLALSFMFIDSLKNRVKWIKENKDE